MSQELRIVTYIQAPVGIAAISEARDAITEFRAKLEGSFGVKNVSIVQSVASGQHQPLPTFRGAAHAAALRQTIDAA